MLVLLAFAVLAGAGTALSPCVLPVLPAVLSAGATGGRRRPIGVVLGLAVTFTLAVVGLATVLRQAGFGDEILRVIAIGVLVGFGVALLVPGVAARIEAPLSRLQRFGPKSAGDGFWGGVGVGGALGLVYAPCAGPILAAVISVSASRGATWQVVALAAAYAAGSAVVLLVFALGGRRVAERIRRAGRGPALQRAVGVVLLATAALMAVNVDVRFQEALASELPTFVSNPTEALEDSDAVRKRLADLRGGTGGVARAAAGAQRGRAPGGPLPVLGEAPEFTGTQRWFNTPGGRPLTLAGLRGRVVLVDFWTYTCINCLRTLPEVRGLDARYRSSGLTVVGVHTPEFAFERDAGNVREAIGAHDLRYPVAQDNEYATWEAYGNQYWPAKYLIDARGRVRYTHFGEGGQAETEAAVRELLAEAGAEDLGAAGAPATAAADAPAHGITPETYLGYERAERFVNGPLPDGPFRFRAPPGAPPLHHLALRGLWRIGGEPARALGRDATLDLSFRARKVYLVLSSRGRRPRALRVELDGRPRRTVTVTRQRLYELVSLPRVGEHHLRLRFTPDLSGFAFTFG